MANYIKKTVHVIFTGGTIGMTKNEKGVLTPSNEFTARIKNTPELHDESLAREYFNENMEDNILVTRFNGTIIKYNIDEYKPPLDSSNMSLDEWKRIAIDIGENYAKYDGFVVLHGTDTLSYAASCLSFMLENLGKTVIVTGAQISIFEEDNDAKDNFLMSLVYAAVYQIPEVCVYFGRKLFRGNRTIKYSTDERDAFKSDNYNVLGEVDTNLRVSLHEEYLPKHAIEGQFKVNSNMNANVDIFMIQPLATSDKLESFLKNNIDGLVLITYGSGNIPTNDKFIQILKDAVESGIIIVNVSECHHGSVNPSYETGKICEDIGILPGFDITTAAALMKLSYVLGFSNFSLEEKKIMMKKNLRGEITQV